MQATQATVSRDLEDLGAIKVRVAGGETVYAIPELPTEQRAPEDHLRRVFGDWVVEVNHSGNLVVLRTPPGLGARRGLGPRPLRPARACSGTVAGDDTLIVVTSEEAGGAAVARQLSDLAGLYDPKEEGTPMAKRVVLAYSGGLDTSVAVRWMIDNLGVEVIALAVDVGQAAEDYEVVKERRPRRRRHRGGRRRRQGGVRGRVLRSRR